MIISPCWCTLDWRRMKKRQSAEKVVSRFSCGGNRARLLGRNRHRADVRTGVAVTFSSLLAQVCASGLFSLPQSAVLKLKYGRKYLYEDY